MLGRLLDPSSACALAVGRTAVRPYMQMRGYSSQIQRRRGGGDLDTVPINATAAGDQTGVRLPGRRGPLRGPGVQARASWRQSPNSSASPIDFS